MKTYHRILPLALLASGLAAATSLAQAPTDSKAPPTKDDVLGGPSVPPDGAKGNDGFTGEDGRGRRAGGAGARGGMMMPFAEVRMLGAAVKDLADLSPETKTAIETELKTFGDAAKKWETDNAEKLKAMQTKMQEVRKAAQESGSPPDPAALESMRKDREALMATAPQTKPVVDKVMGMLTPEQQKVVREKMRPQRRGPGGPGGPDGAGDGKGGPEGGQGNGPGGPGGRGGRGGQRGGGQGGSGGGNPPADPPMDQP